MRIALLHPHTWPEVRRGGERYAHDLAWWLSSHGHDVDLIAGAPAASIEAIDGARVVRVRHHHHRRLGSRGYTPLDTFGLAVLPWLARHRYDVVHAFVPAAAIAAATTRQRVVYTALGHPASLEDTQRTKDRRLFRRALKVAQVSTALSASAAAAAERVTGIRPRVLPPGLRLDVFTPDLTARRTDPLLLFAADAGDQRKRLRIVLDAMPAVLAARPATRLQIGGPGGLPDGVGPGVLAATDLLGVGSPDDVARRFRAATLSVLPSVNEAFGLVLVESMACGTPVVATDSGSMPEIVTTDVGRIAAVDDPAALAASILEVIELAADTATPRRCVDRAAQWSWDLVGPQHLAAYDDARRKQS